MSKFIVSEWFASRANLKIQLFEIEGVEFELMALSESLVEDVKQCGSYEDMLSLAADSGISYNRKRVIDDSELAKDIDMLWSLESVALDVDPCVKYRVGEKVCEISGLQGTLEEMLELEKESETSIDGDNLPGGEVTLGQLEADANNHALHA